MNYRKCDIINLGCDNMKYSAKTHSLLKTMYKNGTCPTSKQQYTIYELLMHEYGEDNCKLNYPCLNYNLDCMLLIGDIRIDVEYDGWAWHKNSEHDNIRNERVLNEGYKILRIKSGFKIPNLENIKIAINHLLKGSNYEEIILDDWIENANT